MIFSKLVDQLKTATYASQFMTPFCPFESGKCVKEEEKLQKIEDLENERSFLEAHRQISKKRCFRKVLLM